uniref:RING-type E3 ubiquitin transferase n=1 Tax=Rhodotorula toruloides TaxID=5286 RepID=A0A0K3CRR5_RHOTO
MAYPVDPGRTVTWAKHPEWEQELVSIIGELPRNEQLRVFAPATRKSAQWKKEKQEILQGITADLFDARGDHDKAAKQVASVQRKLAQLAKEYSGFIRNLVYLPEYRATTNASINATFPTWDLLRPILRDHPDFQYWDENATPPAPQAANDEAADPYDPMQDVRYHDAAQAAAAPAAQPAQPVAGPAYPNPALAHLYAPNQLPNHANNQPATPAAAGQKRVRRDSADATEGEARDARQAAAAAALRRADPLAAELFPTPRPLAPLAREDSQLFASCPKCAFPLLDLSPSEAETHLRSCLDSSGATVTECPVCGMRMDGFTEREVEKHVDDCCKGVGGSGSKAAREHVVFIADAKTVPKDEKTGEALECIMCFDEFEPSQRLARLSCYCCYHEACIVEYWQNPSKFCPTHRELDTTQEIEMRNRFRIASSFPAVPSVRCANTRFACPRLAYSTHSLDRCKREELARTGGHFVPTAKSSLVIHSHPPRSLATRSCCRTCSTQSPMASDSPAEPAQQPKPDSRAPSSSRSASFISADLNVRLSGRIVGDGETGRIEGLQVELDQGGITVKYPQLLSVQTKPESQTLSSINTGERLLTLPTPFITASSGSSDSNEYDDAFEDDSGSSTPKKTVVTLHEGFLPASETEQIEQSPLFSSTFKILIDSPSFPAPHFDPASLAPPTPSVKPLDPTSASSAAAYGGILNSPTLQRALLSPLLSPQRRAASQGSDLSVPPLSLGLSRTSRASFSGAGERPRVQGGGQPSLVSLIPALAPPASGPSTASSSSTDPPHPSSTAEEILSLRRTHDASRSRSRGQPGGNGRQASVRGSSEQYAQSATAQRSRSRTKAVAEATAKAVEGAQQRGQSGSRERAGQSGGGASEERGRGRGPTRGENLPATLEEEGEEEDDRGRSSTSTRSASAPRDSTTDTHNNLLSPSSAAQAVRGPSSSGATPTFIPSKSDPPFEMDEDVDVEELDIGSSRQPAPLESPSLEIVNGDTPPPQSVAGQSRSRQPPSSTQPSSSFRPGSFQRASALSASYNALLASPGALAATKSPLSPPTVQPISPSVAAIRSYGSSTRSSSDFSPSRTAAALNSLDTLPPFSPPEAHAHLTSSARDDAENALAAATFEHATLSRGRRGGEGAGPDPREVRRGEQKIRDVLAMDVPTPSGQIDPATNAFVGSLPITLGRPSTINAALSSWRPDPERLWAQQRRERKTSISSRGEAGWVPPLKTGFGAPMPTQGGRAAAILPHQQASASSSTQPLEIGSPSTPRPVAGGSSLAQSLRHASFSHRAALNERGTNGGASEEAVEDADGQEDEEDDGEFVPPHLVADRKGRRSDEAMLSRSLLLLDAANTLSCSHTLSLALTVQHHLSRLHRPTAPLHSSHDHFSPLHTARKQQWHDFLTQSFALAPARQAEQASSAEHSHPASPDTLDTAHDVSPTTATATNDSNPSLDADVVQTSDKFAALRSHSPAARPLEDEPRIECPSVQKGDWRAYGRVKAQVVLWPEGTVGEKGVKAKKVREVLADKADEWVVEGTLWVTKNKDILLVLDRNIPPFHIDFSNLRASPTLSRRLSLSGLRRTISRTSTTSGGEAREDTEEDKENTGGGVRGFVKKIVEAVKPRGASTSEGGDGLALTRTRSSHKSQRSVKERRKSHDASAGVARGGEEREQREEGTQGAQGGLAFSEPVIERREGPFPAYKGHSITALYISSPYLIRTARFYAQHKPASPLSLGLPISTPPDDAVAQDPSREPREDLGLVPPVVEVDVAQPEEGRKYEGVGEGEGVRMREVTVGFVFPDVLLADEATDFHSRLEFLLRPSSPSGQPTTTTTGSSLFRTLSRGGTFTTTSPNAPPVPASTEEGGEIPSETATVEMLATAPKQRRRGSSFLRGMPQGDVPPRRAVTLTLCIVAALVVPPRSILSLPRT